MKQQPTLKERLDACARSGSLSTADLSKWFTLPYATLKSYRQGAHPYPYRQGQIEQRLRWLEHAVRYSPKLPIPLKVRASERQAYVEGLRHKYESRSGGVRHADRVR